MSTQYATGMNVRRVSNAAAMDSSASVDPNIGQITAVHGDDTDATYDVSYNDGSSASNVHANDIAAE